MTEPVLSDTPPLPLRLRLGRWLHRYRRWGLIPLIAAGLFLHVHSLSVTAGAFMMMAGGVGILFGTLLRIVCRSAGGPQALSRGDGIPPLLTDGPWAITRNPVYLGEAAFALGVAMMSRMPWLIILTAIGATVVLALMIEWEERMLAIHYGSAFLKYCRQVPRWFSATRLLQAESYQRTRKRVKFITAIRAEALTLLTALSAILAFLAKANFETWF